MNPHTSPSRRATRWLLLCVLSMASLAAVPSGSSAMSLVAAHAPDGAITVALGQDAPAEDIAVSRSVGLMEGAGGTAPQAQLGSAPIEVSRSVGLMVGAGGTAAQADLGNGPVLVTRSVGLMEGATT